MTNAKVAKFTRYASLQCCGLLAGVALTVLFVELALRRLDGPEYVRVRQAEFDPLTWFIGAVFVSTLIALVMLVILARTTRSPALRPASVALMLLLLAAVVTVAINGPINVEQLGWDVQAPPADWISVRDRWQLAHAVRTIAILIAFGYLTAVIDRPFPVEPLSGGERCRPRRGSG
jgi:Domain of unknown function (DUF1772)